MSFTRRSFLLGAGTIITASFVKEVATAVADTRSPWLIKPAEAAKAIYYEPFEDHWRLHLGQPAFKIPKPQLLIDNLRWHGHLLDTQQQIDALCPKTGMRCAVLILPPGALQFASVKGWRIPYGSQRECEVHRAYRAIEKANVRRKALSKYARNPTKDRPWPRIAAKHPLVDNELERLATTMRRGQVAPVGCIVLKWSGNG